MGKPKLDLSKKSYIICNVDGTFTMLGVSKEVIWRLVETQGNLDWAYCPATGKKIIFTNQTEGLSLEEILHMDEDLSPKMEEPVEEKDTAKNIEPEEEVVEEETGEEESFEEAGNAEEDIEEAGNAEEDTEEDEEEEAEAEAEEYEEVEEEEEEYEYEEVEVDLDSMSKSEMIEFCQEYGIKVNPKWPTAKIKEVIEQHVSSQ